MKIKIEACQVSNRFSGIPFRLWEKMELYLKDVRLASFETARLDGGGEIDLGKLNLMEGDTELRLVFTMRKEEIV